jgi:hypothetical protein
VQFSNRSKLFAATVSLLIFGTGCGTAKLAYVESCAPMGDAMICPNETVRGQDAQRFLCYRPGDIEPLLERCTKK